MSIQSRAGANLALLSAALRARRALGLRYRGAWRTVHPHVVGRTRRGRLALLAWQTGRADGGAAPEGWRLFDVARLEGIEPTAERFTPRWTERPDDTTPIARALQTA